jgi:uncharacterized protein DUF4389
MLMTWTPARAGSRGRAWPGEMGKMSATASYPIRIDADLEQPSRWLWLFKWFLAIPHYIVLAFLWIAFVLLSMVAFFAILATGRYPRSVFDFNVGVLRWTWRVSYYAYGALGTDRYPPFTLDEVADYPAHLEVAYPEHLSRTLVLFKWWLLAIPHYIIVGVFLGGTIMFGREAWLAGGGLIGILVLVAAVILAFTGRYPQQLFDLILGLNRWSLRVAAYAGLMTDDYPPFRLDTGGHEPGTLTVIPPDPPSVAPHPPAIPGVAPAASRSGWTGGRIASLVVGTLIALTSLGLFAAGGISLWAHTALRDPAGFVTSGEDAFSTSAYAVSSDNVDLELGTASVAGRLLGDVRVRVTPRDPSARVFVGLARTADAEGYLGGVRRTIVSSFHGAQVARTTAGGAPAQGPASQRFWVASSTGTGTQTITWPARSGSWTLLAMNADRSPGLSFNADVGATFPALPWVATGLLAGAAVSLLIGGTMVVAPIRRAERERRVGAAQ